MFVPVKPYHKGKRVNGRAWALSKVIEVSDFKRPSMIISIFFHELAHVVYRDRQASRDVIESFADIIAMMLIHIHGFKPVRYYGSSESKDCWVWKAWKEMIHG